MDSSHCKAHFPPREITLITHIIIYHHLSTQYWLPIDFPSTLASQVFSNAVLTSVLSLLLCSVTQSCPTLCDPMHCSPPDSSVHGLSRQEYWSGLPFPAPGDLPDPGTETLSLESPALAGGFLTTTLPGKPIYFSCYIISIVSLTRSYAISWDLTSYFLILHNTEKSHKHSGKSTFKFWHFSYQHIWKMIYILKIDFI